MWRNHAIALGLAGLLLAGNAEAAWNYQEDKDTESGQVLYTRAIDSVVTPTGDIYHLLVACELRLNMFLVLPDEVSGKDRVRVHFQLGHGTTHATAWRPLVAPDAMSKSVRVKLADWSTIDSEVSAGKGRLTLDIDAPGQKSESVVFDMRGFAENEAKVESDCAAKGIQRGADPAPVQAVAPEAPVAGAAGAPPMAGGPMAGVEASAPAGSQPGADKQ